MNPLIGLAGIIGAVGLLLVFAKRVDVRLSSGELQDHSPRLSVGQVFPRWLWRSLGAVLVIVAVVLAVRVLFPSRTAVMWGNTSSKGSEAMICRVVGSSEGVPAIGYLLNPNVKSSEPFDFRFITSQWPRSVLVNDKQITPPDKGMLLFVNKVGGSIDQVLVEEERAAQHFGAHARLREKDLKAFWISCQPVGSQMSAESRPYQAVVLRKGIFNLPSSKPIASSGTAGGVRNVGKGGNADIVEDTTNVPAVESVEFGLVFKLTGPEPGKSLPIKVVYVYPPSGLKAEDGSGPVFESEFIHSYSVGDNHFIGYTLQEPWELVPGPWLIQLWHRDRKLAEQSLKLYIPSEEKK